MRKRAGSQQAISKNLFTWWGKAHTRQRRRKGKRKRRRRGDKKKNTASVTATCLIPRPSPRDSP